MALRRRALFAVPLVLAGCATWRGGGERIVEAASGREITRDDLLQRIRASDYTLLGELHDNPHHHARRAELLRALGSGIAVVAEQLPHGAPVALGPDLHASLAAAGFDAKGWRWPLHEPLFAALARTGAVLAGGNLARDSARRIAREGEPALPPALAAVLQAAPLGAAAQAVLDADLVAGHCGQLPPARLPGMRWAQRARDASMALALEEARARPALLLAGNGHVRLDHGVGQLLAARHPQARLVSVAFAEPGASVAELSCTHLWITRSVEREDPCAGMVMTGSGADPVVVQA